MKIDRRAALALFGSGTALALPGIASARQAPETVRFAHGVASGDPTPGGAIIWTRATAEEGFAGDIPLRWHVATDAGAAPLISGAVTARGAADHTAKVDLTGLEPGREYHYWFEAADGTASPRGRFRTLPVAAVDELVLAVASCQLYPGGYFNAYADMAALERLDAVVHLGDYIYEYGESGYGTDIGRRLGRLPDPPHEIVSLADYRRRHAQVKADPQIQAAHARAAFICVWDDHEITNDAWLEGAQNHQPAEEGDWAARKAVAMQAYFEWMPIRDPDPLRAHEAIFRSFEFGDLATLAMVETRLLARDRQVTRQPDLPPAQAIAAILAERDRPERELLGPEQVEWLEGVLAASVAAGKPWQVLGNQVLMARVPGPDLEAQLGTEAYLALRERLPAQFRNRVDMSVNGYREGVPFNLDSWDGYPHARERLYARFARAGSRPVVLAGDSHAAWVNNLHDAAGRLAAVELGCTAITSPSNGSVLPRVGRFLEAGAEEVVFCDQDHKGYALLTLTPEVARVEHVTVSTVLEPAFERGVAASYSARPGIDGGTWA
ncbi:MAG: alkaline phosphatase D family protein [Erythrobacter sp.]|nr:MAG: alkaline phosphatase D family protein [Erythrobacter sp.]